MVVSTPAKTRARSVCSSVRSALVAEPRRLVSFSHDLAHVDHGFQMIETRLAGLGIGRNGVAFRAAVHRDGGSL
jgi:hypothetical protein